MDIKESWSFSEWDESKYFLSEDTLSGALVQYILASTSHPDYVGLRIKVGYSLVHNDIYIFMFTGDKDYTFQRKYASVNLVRFLTEVAISEFDQEFYLRKPSSEIYRQRFKARSVDDLLEDINLAVVKLRSEL